MPSPTPGLLSQVIGLCRFRGGPQDLPYNPGLLVALLMISVALDLTSATLLDVGDNALARSLFSTILLLVLCWIALAIRGLRSRYVQTAIALVACSMVFTILIVPLAYLSGPPADSTKTLTSAQIMLAWLGLGVLVWKIAVDAHNVRQAIDAPYGLGLALALAWFIADFALNRVLFMNAA
jgi:hypothetical protein